MVWRHCVERPVDGGIRIDTIYKTVKGSLQWRVWQGASEWAKGNPHVWETHSLGHMIFGILGMEC